MGGHVCKSRGNRQGKLFVQLDFRWKCLIVPPCDLVISSSEYDQSASKLLVSTLLSSRDSNCVFQIKSRFLYYKTKGCWTQARDSKNVEFWGLFWKERYRKACFDPVRFNFFFCYSRNWEVLCILLTVAIHKPRVVAFWHLPNNHTLISVNKCWAGSLFGKMSTGKCTL